jgi:uncharacterized protein YndB with AHSA1/START domain
VIDYSIRIDAPMSLVFELLTDAELLTEWMARDAEVDRQPGGRFRWLYENGDVVRGRFIEIDAPRRLRLAYGWEIPEARGIPPDSTEVEITLEEVDGSTLLRLVHTGLPARDVESHRAGWEYFLGRLAAASGRASAPIRSTGGGTT